MGRRRPCPQNPTRPVNSSDRWREAFQSALTDEAYRVPLGKAMQSGSKGQWTSEFTAAVVESCNRVGWASAARGHPLELLPQSAQEYLSIDVTAFNHSEPGWGLPIGVFELENDVRRLPFSLWKVLVASAPLRVVVGYVRDENRIAETIERLRQEVIESIDIPQLSTLPGRVYVIIGSRGEAATFPYGFFRWWRLNRSTGQFEIA